MSRRTAAGLLALALMVGGVAFAVSKPVGYVTFRPGPTLNVLGKLGDHQIIQIVGHKSYPDGGSLRMVTVYQSSADAPISLVGMLTGWADPDVAVLPRDVIFPKATTDKQQQAESAQEMVSSQDAATAAALTAAGISYVVRSTITVDAVDATGPAAGKLRKGDVLTAVDGKRETDGLKLVGLLRAHTPGDPVEVTVKRAGTEQNVRMITVPATDDPKAARIGIGIKSSTPDYVFPFQVKINVGNDIGGPSAGMMFALSIYDLLTPGAITGGKVIAGSGEISPEGVVGPIGGIGQKIAGAQRDGARLFLVAKENCAEAATAHYDRKKVRLVEVHTLSDAIKAVDTWRVDPNAKLKGCG